MVTFVLSCNFNVLTSDPENIFISIYFIRHKCFFYALDLFP